MLRQQFMAVAIRKGDDALLKTVNDLIAKNMANGKLNKLYEKWLKTPLPANACGIRRFFINRTSE